MIQIGITASCRPTNIIEYTVGRALRFWIFLYLPILPILIGWHIIAGLALSVVNPIIGTVMQERLPAEMRARVFGTVTAGTLAGIPLGTFFSGYMVAWFGLQTTLLLMGILYLVATLSLLVNPALKAMDKES